MSPSSQKRKPRFREVDGLVQDHTADDSRDSACAPSQTLFPTLSPRGMSGPGLSPCLWLLCHCPRQPGMGPACLSPQVSGPLTPARLSPTAFLWQPGANNQLVQLLCWLLQAWGEARTQAKPLNTEHKPSGGLHPLPTLLKPPWGPLSQLQGEPCCYLHYLQESQASTSAFSPRTLTHSGAPLPPSSALPPAGALYSCPFPSYILPLGPGSESPCQALHAGS